MPITHISTLSIGGYAILSGIVLTASARTLTAQEFKDYQILEVTTGHASNAIIVPVSKGAVAYISNKDGTNAVLVKRNGQVTPVTIAAGKTAAVYCDGTDYKRLTADA